MGFERMWSDGEAVVERWWSGGGADLLSIWSVVIKGIKWESTQNWCLKLKI